MDVCLHLGIALVYFSLTLVNSQDPRCVVMEMKHGTYEVFRDDRTYKGVRYSCNHGYSAVGATHSYCTYSTGTWSNKRPVCVVPGCPNPGFLRNGRVSLSYNNAVAYFTCDVNYYIDGERTLYCDGQNWSNSTPTCKSSRRTTDDNREGGRGRDPGRRTDGQASYQSLVDNSDRTCHSDYRYSTPPSIENAHYRQQWQYSSLKAVYVMVANYTCNTGYVLRDVNSRYLFCRSYTWTAPSRPQCVQEVRNPCDTNNGGCQHFCQASNDQVDQVVCSCKSGYDLAADDKSCADHNECLDNNGGCEQECLNTRGSFFCTCREGYDRVAGGCLDIDECVLHLDECEDLCFNTPGSYRCACRRDGFRLAANGFRCEDINECSSNDTNDCHHKCINTPGSYVCQCDLGHVMLLTGFCEACRINSYQTEVDTLCEECPLNSETEGTGKTSLTDCTCKRGFGGSPVNNEPCIDLNECDDENFGCSHRCMNTPGSALCLCPHGFRLQGDDKTCLDIDECSVNGGGCDHGCINLIGSYQCTCNTGYIWDSELNFCKDEDECLTDNGGCSDVCENYDGGYYCSCPEGHVLQQDGKLCSAANCPPLPPPTSGSLSPLALCHPDDGIVKVGTVCVARCQSGYRLTGSKARKCQSDGTWDGQVAVCKIKSCKRLQPPAHGNILPDTCSSSRTPFKKQCIFSCDEGYTLKGSALITCGQGLKWKPHPPTCVKAECSPPCHPDFGVCTLNGTCQCTVGYHGETCADCALYPGCQHGTCEEPFDCLCEEGWGGLLCDKDLIRPTVLFCPPDIEETSTTETKDIIWEEPIFEDNFEIASISKSRVPGSAFNWGQSEVTYVATDTGGLSVNCTFTVSIKRIDCGSPLGPRNGDVSCSTWMFGMFCVPTCLDGYMFHQQVIEVYGCGADGIWKPSQEIPDCVGFRPVDGVEDCLEGEEFWEDLHRCVQCPTGMFRGGDTSDQTECRNCSSGSYQDEIGQSYCKMCSEFQYQDREGQSHCHPCPSMDSNPDFNWTTEIREQCSIADYFYNVDYDQKIKAS